MAVRTTIIIIITRIQPTTAITITALILTDESLPMLVSESMTACDGPDTDNFKMCGTSCMHVICYRTDVYLEKQMY